MTIATKDAFTDFFKDPSRETLHEIMSLNPEETNEVDFKKDWDEPSKLAKHLLAMANTGGGIIIHGVEQKDNVFTASGLTSRTDKADVSKKLKSYLSAKLIWDIKDFVYNNEHELSGKIFQVVFVNYDPSITPLVSLKDGTGINQNRIYIRRKTESAEANYEEIQDIIKKRLSSTFRSSRKLTEHLEELKALYSSLDRYLRLGDFLSFSTLGANPKFPKEDFETFVIRMIDIKKEAITKIVEDS